MVVAAGVNENCVGWAVVNAAERGCGGGRVCSGAGAAVGVGWNVCAELYGHIGPILSSGRTA